MTRNLKMLPVVLAVLALAALPAVAAEYNIDTSHSAITRGLSIRSRFHTVRNGTPSNTMFRRMVRRISRTPRRSR